MKQPEYTEGPEALANFERGMTALFKAPKQPTKKGKRKDTPTVSPRAKFDFGTVRGRLLVPPESASYPRTEKPRDKIILASLHGFV